MEMITTLSLCCRSFGWNGGTIHQAKERFAIASLNEMDKLCSLLSANIANVSDPQTALYFLGKRKEAIRLHTIGEREL